MADPIGPVYEGNIEEFVVTEGGYTYRMLYLPDKNNEQLQREGKSPYYYWLPKDVRIARNSSTGDYKFHLLHFVGVQDEDTHVGVEGHREVAGGVLSVTTTAEPPTHILEKSHEQLRQKFRGSDNPYWGWRSPAKPKFGVMPIVESQMTISNLSPMADGSMPIMESETAIEGVDDTNNSPEGGGSSAPESKNSLVPRIMDMPRTINERELNIERSSLDAWSVKMEGQGPGSIDPAAEHAFTALLGSYPTAILWKGFKGAYSPVSVVHAMKLKVWSQNVYLRIEGKWDRIFTHFSKSAKAGAVWFSADIEKEFNNLVINGGIKVDLMIDGTVPGADEMKEKIEQTKKLILERFMDQAKDRIFEPAPPEVKPQKPSKLAAFMRHLGGAAGRFDVGYKLRRDEQHIDLYYEENISERYTLNHCVSSTLEGFFNEIKADPKAEQKYFTTLYLDDWDRKVTHIIKPVANYPDKAKLWVGDPIAFMSCQIGYPNTNGILQWQGEVFEADTEQTWRPAVSMKAMNDVVNPPAGWEPSKTFVKRKVFFLEPPGENENPYMRVFVEKNDVDLDPGEYGTLTDEITLEIRADSTGKLEVGPIMTNVELENSKQFLEVSFRAKGETHDGHNREERITRFGFQYDDQNVARYWEIFTGQLDFVPNYEYMVRVVVKGTIFSQGMEWQGDWTPVYGNGPIMVKVPTPNEAVEKRNLTSREINSSGFLTSDISKGSEYEGEVIEPPIERTRLSEYIGAPEEGLEKVTTNKRTEEDVGDLTSISGWHSFSSKQ